MKGLTKIRIKDDIIKEDMKHHFEFEDLDPHQHEPDLHQHDPNPHQHDPDLLFSRGSIWQKQNNNSTLKRRGD